MDKTIEALLGLIAAYKKQDYFNNIARLSIIQSILRSFNSFNDKYTILHGSACVGEDSKVLIFGDDGYECRGKTLCSLYMASLSKQYISDEYVIYENSTNKIIGCGSIPVSLKGKTVQFLNENTNMSLPDEEILYAEDYFEIKQTILPDALIIPYVGQLENTIVQVFGEERDNLLKATFYGHKAKFLNSELDRLSIIGNKNTNSPIDMRGSLNEYRKVNFTYPVFKLLVKDLIEIPNLLRKINYHEIQGQLD